MRRHIKRNKPSTLKKVIVITILFISIFGGIYMAVIGIENFKNYKNPFIFGFIFGTVGLLLGFIVSRQIKPYVILNSKMLANYSPLSVMFSLGFIGIFLLVGQTFNSKISHLSKCDEFFVIGKKFQEKAYRQTEKFTLVIDIEGETQRLLTHRKYWDKVKIGQRVEVCIYKSSLGFDYFTIKDE